jgi:zinc transport system ATP-binding protein
VPGLPVGRRRTGGRARMTAPTGTLIEARGVTVRFGGHTAVDGVDLAVHAGEIVTLIGPNGAGKTTLVRAVLGLVAPESGTIERRAGLRVGYAPQRFHVDGTLPLTVRRFLTLARPASGRDAAGALAEVGLDGFTERPLVALSGGESRRVLLARALLKDPEFLVLDEPSAGVDVAGQAELYELLRRIRDRRRCGILLVSHDLHLVMAATDRVLCLNHHICCAGQPETVTRHPEYLALFGTELRGALAVYTHDHDHRHDLAGDPLAPATAGHDPGPGQGHDHGRHRHG